MPHTISNPPFTALAIVGVALLALCSVACRPSPPTGEALAETLLEPDAPRSVATSTPAACVAAFFDAVNDDDPVYGADRRLSLLATARGTARELAEARLARSGIRVEWYRVTGVRSIDAVIYAVTVEGVLSAPDESTSDGAPRTRRAYAFRQAFDVVRLTAEFGVDRFAFAGVNTLIGCATAISLRPVPEHDDADRYRTGAARPPIDEYVPGRLGLTPKPRRDAPASSTPDNDDNG